MTDETKSHVHDWAERALASAAETGDAELRLRAIADRMRSRILQVQCGLLAAALARQAGDMEGCVRDLAPALATMRANGYVEFAGWHNAMVGGPCKETRPNG